MKKFFVSGIKNLVVFGVIATAGVPAAVPPSLCHDDGSEVVCVYIPIIAQHRPTVAHPEDGAPLPPDPK